MKPSLKALTLTLFSALPLSAQALCVLAIGDCGDEFTAAAQYPDCANLSLQDAAGVPDDPKHTYAFNGTCRPKNDSLIVPAKVSATWDGTTHQAQEAIKITGFDGGSISAVFTCENDPFISNAPCSLVQMSNGTKFDYFTNYLTQQHRPVTHNKAKPALATALSKQHAAGTSPPPPPPAPKPGSATATLRAGASSNAAPLKATGPVLAKPDLTVDYATGLILAQCQPNQPVLKVDVTVKNVGGLATPASRSAGFVTVKEIGGTTDLNGGTGLGAVAAGGSRKTEVYLKSSHALSDLVGHHDLSVVLDPSGNLGESNTTNNTYALSVDFPSGYCQTARLKHAPPATAVPVPTPRPSLAPPRMVLPSRQ